MCIPLKYTCEYNSIILVLYTSQYTSVFSTFCMVEVTPNVDNLYKRMPLNPLRPVRTFWSVSTNCHIPTTKLCYIEEGYMNQSILTTLLCYELVY